MTRRFHGQVVQVGYRVDEVTAAQLRTRLPSDQLEAEATRECFYFDTETFAWSRQSPISRWLRLDRLPNGSATISSQTLTFDDSGTVTEWLESKRDVADFESARRTLAVLGFKQLVAERRQRATWRVAEDVTVHIDQVEGLGHFVHLEMLADFTANLTEVQRELVSRASVLGIQGVTADARGYVYELIALANETAR